MEIEKKFQVDLPKWTEMTITGKSVSKKQAMEIIRRTDKFFAYPSGNNKSFVEKAKEILHYPDSYEENLKWLDKWGYVDTAYVENDWISCSYIYGPHGWMHPDGTIFYDDNIGKYPEVKELYDDFLYIAKAFPFLEMEVIIYDKEMEADERTMEVGFLIKDGNVTVVDPYDVVLYRQSVGRDNVKAPQRTFINPFDKNSGITFDLSQIQEWYNKI